MRIHYAIAALQLLAVMLCAICPASAQTDSAAISRKKPVAHYGHQIRFGFDISKPVINLAQNTYSSYEAEADYYIRNEVYGVAEGGFGSAKYEYPDLRYNSNSAFFRIGLDKTLITRIAGNDWDAAFIGMRYGAAFVNRKDAAFTIIDSLWGFYSGAIPAQTFTAHWAEVTGGVRVELLRNVFAGWNVRGRFLLNGRSFQELAPVFIAGYGRGDKSTVFDFNFFICYALRWGSEAPKKATP